MDALKKIIQHYNDVLAYDNDAVALSETDLEHIYAIDYAVMTTGSPILTGTQRDLFYQMLGIVRMLYRQYDTDENRRVYDSDFLGLSGLLP